ncbi:MAG TPA: pyrroline-5-carboxylate reductase dimerization domain-containing protein [Nitrospirota bacterium]|nr:pyrroline-5-carboxylate reductase dimerization domain-containing protein [Nitrospirota bacterium]
MEKIGFIGAGSMGKTLATCLLKFGALNPSEVLISTRSKDKMKDLLSCYPDVNAAKSNVELAQRSKTIFLCVRTGDVKGVLQEIRPHLVSDCHLIYISAGLTSKNIEKLFNGKLTKVIPSLTCEVRDSVSLVFHNKFVTTQDASAVEKLFSCLGIVKVIDEDHFEIGADMTSCAPAFIACIFKHFVAACEKHSRFKKHEAERMVLTTLLGTAELLHEKNMGFDSLISAVATKGGISEEGIKVLDQRLPSVFDELLEATLNRHNVIKSSMDKQYL